LVISPSRASIFQTQKSLVQSTSFVGASTYHMDGLMNHYRVRLNALDKHWEKIVVAASEEQAIINAQRWSLKRLGYEGDSKSATVELIDFTVLINVKDI
jgi:hypothetical protein